MAPDQDAQGDLAVAPDHRPLQAPESAVWPSCPLGRAGFPISNLSLRINAGTGELEPQPITAELRVDRLERLTMRGSRPEREPWVGRSGSESESHWTESGGAGVRRGDITDARLSALFEALHD